MSMRRLQALVPAPSPALVVPHGVSLRSIAAIIHGLNSRLVALNAEAHAGTISVSYIFDVAGRQQAFRIEAAAETLPSIADLYPEAAPYEQALSETYRLVFRLEP